MIIQPSNRNQITMFSCPEDLIGQDNPVRIIDCLIDSLIMNNPKEYKYKGESTTGRPAYPVEVMLKLFLYGCINRITSSRRLECETKRNIELMWLTGNLTPDFKTIADFRKDNKQIIKTCSKDLKSFLKHNNLISGETFAIDGTKIKANANRYMLSKAEIVSRLSRLEEEMEYYMNQLDKQDENELYETAVILKMQEENENHKKTIFQMSKEINQLTLALEKLESDKKNYISLTDMDCSKQKSRDGIIPGYNVQLACDTKYGFIVAEDVTAESNDINQLEPMVDEIKNELGLQPITIVADTGYSNYEDIQKIEETGIECYIPPQKLPSEKSGITFSYEKANNRYKCSQGKYLKLKAKNKKYKNSRVNVYVGESCQSCQLMKQCTKSKIGRHISRYWNQEYRDKHRAKMETPVAKAMSKLRKCSIEHIFGTVKTWLGKIPILTRGKPKVKTEVRLAAISFNIRRLMNLFTHREIMSMIMGFLRLNYQSTNVFKLILSFYNNKSLFYFMGYNRFSS